MVLGRTRLLIPIADAKGVFVSQAKGRTEAKTFQRMIVNFGMFSFYDA